MSIHSVAQLRLTRAAAIVAAVALVVACGLTSSSVGADAPGQTRVPGATISDADDFYYFDGKPVPLDRATAEFVLGVADETDVIRLIRDSAVPATAGDPILSRGRRFVVVKVEPRGTGSMAQLIEAMRARRDVWFASPVYYQPATRVRIVPTDELIVRTKASVTPDDLSGVLQAQGLRRVSLIEGTTDQYLLRIVSAKNADVLRVSRTLFATEAVPPKGGWMRMRASRSIVFSATWSQPRVAWRWIRRRVTVIVPVGSQRNEKPASE